MITRLPIDCVVETVIVPVKLSEIDDMASYKDEVFIVNSPDDIPDNKIIDSDDLKAVNIDFTRQSMIILYQMQIGKIVSSEYRWLYNDWEEYYLFDSVFKKIKDSEYENGEIENFSYIRSALIVKQISPTSRISWSVDIKD